MNANIDTSDVCLKRFFFLKKKIQVYLVYSVGLISAVQQSVSYTYIHVFLKIYLLFIFFFIVVYHKILNTVLCAVHSRAYCLSILYVAFCIC